MHPDFRLPSTREVVTSSDGIVIALCVTLAIAGVLFTGTMWAVIFGPVP